MECELVEVLDVREHLWHRAREGRVREPKRPKRAQLAEVDGERPRDGGRVEVEVGEIVPLAQQLLGNGAAEAALA